MKPDWKDAPEWANWLAMDDCGAWYWWDMEPVFLGDVGWMGEGRYEAASDIEASRISLEARP